MFLTAALESLNSLFSASLDEWKEASKAQKVEKLSLPSPSKVLKSKLTQVYEKEPQIDELLNSIAMIRKDLMGRQAAGSGGAATSNPRSSTVQTGIVRNSIQPKQSITGTRTARFPTFDFPSIKRIDARNTLSKPTEESKETVIPVKVDNPNGKAEEIKALPTPQIANVVVPVVDVKAVAPIAEPPKEVIEKVAVQTSKPETQAPTTILEPTTAPITIPSPKSLVFKPTSVAETTSPIISVEDSIDLNVSMDLDLGLELVHPRVSIDPLTIPISKSQVPANIYHGNATSFLPPNVQKQVINDKPVTFIPSTYTKAKERAKPVIAALKTAELAAKREKEERDRKAKEKEMRRLAIETKKKEGVKRPLVVTEEARKKVMVKKPLVTSKPKLPLPIKNAILVKPTTLVDSNGEIMGINEVSSSDSEAPSPPKATSFVPAWAQSPFLRKTLNNQGMIDPDEIFTSIEKPNLREIMGSNHRKTMSLSGNEQMEMLSVSEEMTYKQQMGFKPSNLRK